jgi:hypothetical protein
MPFFFVLTLKFDLYWEHAQRQLRLRLIIGSYGGQAVHIHHSDLTELDANLFPIGILAKTEVITSVCFAEDHCDGLAHTYLEVVN